MTMVEEIDKLLDDYRAWLKDKTTLREVNGNWVEITTPYLGPPERRPSDLCPPGRWWLHTHGRPLYHS